MFFKRMVLELNELDMKKYYRVLWINENHTELFLIDIYDPKAVPFFIKVENCNEWFNSKIARVIDEPYLKEGNFTIKSKEIWEQRVIILDRLLKEISAPQIFESKKNWAILLELEKSLDCTANYMKKILRMYWQKGLNKNALIPKYGRKKIADISNQKLRLPQEIINQKDTWKELIISSFHKYYKRNPQATMRSAYADMIEHHFTNKNETEGTLKLEEYIPSYWQFEYQTRYLRYTEDTLRHRWGAKNFELKGRTITSNTQEKIFGPGSLFQIDATIADAYIVSELNREDIIGRPIIYFLTDAFSRLITGLYCGLEGPSWNGAMMAIVNSASDKVAFCSYYGIEINETDWPCSHIPEVIRADRGEMLSKKAEEMIRLQDITIENTPPFRADLKGIVERKFGTIQGSIKPFLPGYVDKDFGERGAKDYRTQAALTLKEFTEIIIREVLLHNKSLIKGYKKTKNLLRDMVPAIPLDLWNWGLEKQSGLLRRISVQELKLSLMPSYDALVTAQGLKFHGMFYTSKKAIQEEWFSRARTRGNWKIKIRVDERLCEYVYYWNELTNELELFQLVPFDKERFQNLSLSEVISLNAFESFHHKKEEKMRLEQMINKNSSVRKIVENAKLETKNSLTDKSNNKKIKNIRENRLREKEEFRKEEAFYFGNTINKEKNDKISEDVLQDNAEAKEDVLEMLDNFEKESGW